MGRWSGKTCRLTTMLVFTASFFLVEIIVGTVTNSIALVADSFHMLSDVVALIVGFASVRISKWKSKRNTYGWQRAEVLGALVNSVFLLALCFSILIESVKRLVELEHVDDPILMLVVGVLGLLVNIFGLFLFGGHGHSHGGGGHHHGHSHGGNMSHSHGKHSHVYEVGHNAKRSNGTLRQDGGEGMISSVDNAHTSDQGVKEGLSQSQISTTDATMTSVDSTIGTETYPLDTASRTEVVKHSAHSKSESLNMRGVFLHVLGDALGSVVVVISALVIMFGEGDWKYYLDPAMSIMMVCIILGTTIPLFKESAYILLQTVPRHVNVEAITRELREMDGIAGVHECHIWQLAGRRIIASAHVHCKDIMEYMVLANKIKGVFHHHGIHSTTIQPEFPVHPGDDQTMCAFVCYEEGGKKCELDTCCGPAKPKQITGNDNCVDCGQNNSNNSDAAHLLGNSSAAKLLDGNGEVDGASGSNNRLRSSTWSIPIEMSPEGDEMVLDLSKAE